MQSAWISAEAESSLEHRTALCSRVFKLVGVKRIHRNPDRSGSAEDPFESSKIRGSADPKKKKRKNCQPSWYCRLNRTMNADFPPPEKNCIQVHAVFLRRRKVRVHSSIQTTVCMMSRARGLDSCVRGPCAIDCGHLHATCYSVNYSVMHSHCSMFKRDASIDDARLSQAYWYIVGANSRGC